MKPIRILLMCFICISCNKNDNENAYSLAKEYCDCLTSLSRKDSIIDAQHCASGVFSKSRFFNIKFSDKKDSYSASTLDSAEHFFLEVRNIIDTMCLNKIPEEMFKKNSSKW